MDSELRMARKRRLSDENTNNGLQSKRIHEEVEREEKQEFGFLSFSDEIFMHIMGYLDTGSLIQLSRTCSKLQNLAADKTLWTNADLSYEPMTGENLRSLIFKDVCRYSEIRSLTLRGLVSLHPVEKWKNQTVTPTFLTQLTKLCPHLQSITIHEACLDISKVTILNFPTQLRQFNVNRCEIICSEKPTSRRDISFFTGINSHLTDLEQLYVENCNWFDTHDLIAFSKLPALKELSLRGCNSFKECVPYGSIATRFGFRALEVLDVRNTPVTDSDIQCFNMTKSLKELRLQCPERAKEKTDEVVRTSDGAGPSSGESSTTASASNSPTPLQSPASALPFERHVINLHLRRLDRARQQNDPVDPPAPVVNSVPAAQPPPPPPVIEGNNQPEIVREDADGAVIQAGNNNVRINIRNQNVQGRHVIHIAIRNSHNCGRNQAEQGGPNDNDNNNQHENEPGNNAADPVAEPENNQAPNNGEANNNEQANGNEQEQGAQHYIMIRGFRDEEGDDFNAAGIVQ